MRLATARSRMALAMGLWLASAAPLWSAAPGAASGDAVDAQIAVLTDPTRADEQRAAARNNLVNILLRPDKAAAATAAERILKLGRETNSDRVRLDVAYILAQTRNRKSILPADYTKQAIELLTKWLNGKDTDAAVRLWAATGLAASQDPSVIPLLKEKCLGPGSDPVIRVAVARALANWRGESLTTQVLPILMEFLKDKDPEMRIAGCDALRLTEQDSVATVEALLEVARNDKDERVWRTAVAALRRLGGGTLNIAAGASPAEREGKLQAWENIWRSKKKRPEAKEKG